MKTPIEREYRVTYDKRGWGDETIWTRESVEFTEHDAARDYFLWIKDKPWVRYPDVEARPAPQPWLHHAQPETPPVELPTEATFGVLTWTAGPNTARPGEIRRVAANWQLSPCVSGYYRDPENRRPTQIHAVDFGMYIPLANVTAFTPAVAVPKAALDDLRSAPETARRVVLHFLAAVDEANR